MSKTHTFGPGSHRHWRKVAVLAIVAGLLWWPGSRICYFCWRTTFGASSPFRNKDFTRLAKVLPPAEATLAVTYEGLPHQTYEAAELWHDLFTTSNRSIGGYRFYTAPTELPSALRASINAAMRRSSLYQPYRGPKLCGGYHPDYCFEWHTKRDTFFALLCTGCREVILIGGGGELLCDLNDEPGIAFVKLLDVYGRAKAHAP